jgi:hypothetical protein
LKSLSDFPGFFNFSTEALNKQFNLRLVECSKDFSILCNERIFPKIFESSSSSTLSESSFLDKEIISTLQGNLRKVKDDEKMEVVKDAPAKTLVDGWGKKYSNEVSVLKKEISNLKRKVGGFKNKPFNKGNSGNYKNFSMNFSRNKGNENMSSEKHSSNNFSNVSLKVDWWKKAEFAKADLRSATIKIEGKILKFNPKIPIKSKDATVKIGSVLFWRNGSLVKNRKSFFVRENVVKNSNVKN